MAEHIEAARREAETEADFKIAAVSLFVGGPHNRQITLQEAERDELAEYLSRTGITAIAHSSYTAVPWRGDPDAARFIREEAGVCRDAGIVGLVVHLPKAPVAQVMRYAERLLNPDAPGVRIYLEIPAVRPAESYYETPAKLETLFRALRGIDPPLGRFGLCIDTAHLWTAGVDLRTYAAADAWLQALEQRAGVIPPSHVMAHLNDSQRPRGVGPDKHAPLAQGRIWEAYRDRLPESGLAAFTDYAQRHNTVAVLERKPKDSLLDDYAVLRELVPSARAG
jgi:deoxyribonuclease-4